MKHLHLVIFLIILTCSSYLLAEPYSGEIIHRQDDEIQATFFKREGNTVQRAIHATVYKQSKRLVLPGTDETLVSEWEHIGEVKFNPPFSSGIKGILLSEKYEGAVQRGCQFTFLENRAPVWNGVKSPKSYIAPGTRMLIAANAIDPEGDPVVYDWKCSAGKWLSDSGRNFLNYYIAPSTEESVSLDLYARDLFGASVKQSLSLNLSTKQNKDLYLYKYRYFDPEMFKFPYKDVLQSPRDGNLWILTPSVLFGFSPQGYLLREIRGVFKDGTCMAMDAEQNHFYVLDKESRKVIKMNMDGKILSELKDGSESGDSVKFINPVDIEADSKNRVYLLDRELSRIFFFHPNGHLLGAYGIKGSQEGQLMDPQAMSMTPEGDFLILDIGKLHIAVFNAYFQFQYSIPLSDRYQYLDIHFDAYSRNLYILSQLNSGNIKETHILEYDMTQKSFGATLKLARDKGQDSQKIRQDNDGDLVVFNPGKIDSLHKISLKGKWRALFGANRPNKNPTIKAGRLGQIYIDQGKTVQRVNFFGWMDLEINLESLLINFGVDQSNRVYTLGKNADLIRIYDSIGNHFKDVKITLKKRDKIIDFATDFQGNMYCLRASGEILKISQQTGGQTEIQLGALVAVREGVEKTLKVPVAMAMLKDGSLCVYDKSQNAMFIFDLKNESSHKAAWFACEPKKYGGMDTDLYGNMYVLDELEKSVLKYTSSGSFRKEISLKKEIKKPTAISVYGDGELMVFDDSNKTISLYQ